MAGKRPRFTENFSANLSAVEKFLAPQSRATFRRFLARLFDDAIPTLCRFPLSGRPFLARTIKSTKASMLRKQLSKLLKKEDDLREFAMDEFLVGVSYTPRSGDLPRREASSTAVVRSQTILA